MSGRSGSVYRTAITTAGHVDYGPVLTLRTSRARAGHGSTAAMIFGIKKAAARYRFQVSVCQVAIRCCRSQFGRGDVEAVLGSDLLGVLHRRGSGK